MKTTFWSDKILGFVRKNQAAVMWKSEMALMSVKADMSAIARCAKGLVEVVSKCLQEVSPARAASKESLPRPKCMDPPAAGGKLRSTKSLRNHGCRVLGDNSLRIAP